MNELLAEREVRLKILLELVSNGHKFVLPRRTRHAGETKENQSNRLRDYRRERRRRLFAEDPEYRAKEQRWNKNRKPIKSHTAANQLVNRAVRNGELVKPDHCSECGCNSSERRIEGHHEDYSKPLEVVWLCTECHGKRHRKY